MIFGSMKEVFLVQAKEMFVFDCRVSGFDLQAVNAYRTVINDFIRFAGNIKVSQLTPDHMEMYFANLCDGPCEGVDHASRVMSQYAMIQTWIRWMRVQTFITERADSVDRPVDLEQIFPPRSVQRLAHCE